MLAILLGLTGASMASGEDGLPAACAYDRDAMLALDAATFDTTADAGWRAIGDKPGCEAVAADLITAYRGAHPSSDPRSLLHHEAQLRAASGQTDRAIALLHEALPLDTPEMAAYHEAMIAFLSRDRAGLEAARERLAAVPKPAGFEAGVARARAQWGEDYAKTITWPLNLDTVDGLVNCFDRPYTEAYSRACRPAPAR